MTAAKLTTYRLVSSADTTCRLVCLVHCECKFIYFFCLFSFLIFDENFYCVLSLSLSLSTTKSYWLHPSTCNFCIMQMKRKCKGSKKKKSLKLNVEVKLKGWKIRKESVLEANIFLFIHGCRFTFLILISLLGHHVLTFTVKLHI